MEPSGLQPLRGVLCAHSMRVVVGAPSQMPLVACESRRFGHTSLWASWLWGASLSLADLSNVAGSNCLSVTSRMDSAAPPSTCPAPSDPSGRVHSQTFCARRNQFWRGAPRCRRQTPSCDGVSRRSSSQAPLSLYCFLAALPAPHAFSHAKTTQQSTP